MWILLSINKQSSRTVKQLTQIYLYYVSLTANLYHKYSLSHKFMFDTMYWYICSLIHSTTIFVVNITVLYSNTASNAASDKLGNKC